MTHLPAFEVSKEGLAKILARRGIEFAVLELVQNALDEDVRRVDVALTRMPLTRRRYTLVVEDDCPTGFVDISHAYTLYAESAKKSDPSKRGRFNLGEKLVIAVCDSAEIETTTGTVRFDGNKRVMARGRRDHGSKFTGILKLDATDFDRVDAAMRQILVPTGIDLYWNGERLEPRDVLREIEATLPTEIADAEGYLRPTERKTTISIYATRDGEAAMLYEMGLPVVDTGDTYHVSVGQKVPLNSDRDNVTFGFLRRVRTAVMNAMHTDIDEAAARAPWASEAIGDPDIDDAAVASVLEGRYGPMRVIRDPSDPEGTKLAMSKGYAIIEPGSFTARQWDQIRRSGAALPAGRVTPSSRVEWSANGKDVTIPTERWTPGLMDHMSLAQRLGSLLLGINIHVSAVADATRPYAACWGREALTYNVGRMGWDWFAKPANREEHIDLLIHEFGHHYSLDHLSSKYHDALSRLGARLALAVRDNPGTLDVLPRPSGQAPERH